MTALLFIGETWRGSSARSLREAVDAYSIPGRAGQVLAHIRALIEERAA